jgi:hypothetical protein
MEMERFWSIWYQRKGDRVENSRKVWIASSLDRA